MSKTVAVFKMTDESCGSTFGWSEPIEPPQLKQIWEVFYWSFESNDEAKPGPHQSSAEGLRKACSCLEHPNAILPQILFSMVALVCHWILILLVDLLFLPNEMVTGSSLMTMRPKSGPEWWLGDRAVADLRMMKAIMKAENCNHEWVSGKRTLNGISMDFMSKLLLL